MRSRSPAGATALALIAGLLLASARASAQVPPLSDPSFRTQLALARDTSRSAAERAGALRVAWRSELPTLSTIDEVTPLLADRSPAVRVAAVTALGEAARMIPDHCSPGVGGDERDRAAAVLRARARDERDDRVLFALYALSNWQGDSLLSAPPSVRRRALVVAEFEGDYLTTQLLALDRPFSRIESVEVHATDLETHSNDHPRDVRCETSGADEETRGNTARFAVTVRCPAGTDSLPWVRRAVVRVRLRGGVRFTDTLLFSRAQASGASNSGSTGPMTATHGGRVFERR